MKLPKERLVSGKMRSKMGRPFEASIHVTEGDHRGKTWKRRGSKKREFVDKVAHSLLIGCSALVCGSWQVLLGNAQFLAKEVHFFLLRFEVGQFLVGQNEVEKDQPCTHKTKRVPLAVAEVVLLHLAVDRSGKEMEQGSSACLATNAGVSLVDKFFSKGGRAFAVAGTCKGAELSQREVAGKHSNDVEKASLGLGVAQASDSLNVNAGNIHLFQISRWIRSPRPARGHRPAGIQPRFSSAGSQQSSRQCRRQQPGHA